MNIQQIKYFVELSKYKSFTTAAEKLFISQQGLSMAILRLESEFNCKFFNRTPKGLVLTPQGEFFLERAKVIIEKSNECEEHFSNPDPSKKDVAMCASIGTIAEYGADIIKKFKDENVNANIIVDESYDYAVDEAVEAGRVELAFGIEPINTDKFDYIRMFSAPAMLIVSKDHPLANETIVSNTIFDGLPMALVDERFKTSEDFLKTMRKENVNPNVQMRTGEILAVHRLAASGIMCGFTNKSIATVLNTPDTVLIPLEDVRFTWSSGIMKLKGASLSPAAEKFWKLCEKMAKKGEWKSVSPLEFKKFSDEDD